MSEELKPCPFCGGEAERITLHDQDNFGGDVISCKKCECCTRVLFGEKAGLAESWNTRAELAALKAGQGEAVAEVISAYGDPEAFGEREVKVLADLSKIPYGTKLYTAPPASADAVSVPRELLERLCPVTAADGWKKWNTATAYEAAKELRALLAQSESKGVK